jgi:hypothetical protein
MVKKTVSILSKGSPSGEVSFIDNAQRSVTVIAGKKTGLIEINAENLTRLP